MLDLGRRGVRYLAQGPRVGGDIGELFAFADALRRLGAAPPRPVDLATRVLSPGASDMLWSNWPRVQPLREPRLPERQQRPGRGAFEGDRRGERSSQIDGAGALERGDATRRRRRDVDQ